MSITHRRRSWEPRQLKETPEQRVFEWSAMDRRTLLRRIALAGVAIAGGSGERWSGGIVESALADENTKTPGSEFFPARRNERFRLDRPITDELAASRYNN